MVGAVEKVVPKVVAPTKPNKLAPLSAPLTKEIIRQMKDDGATFFDWKEFSAFAANRPPSTPMTELLKEFKAQLEKQKGQ